MDARTTLPTLGSLTWEPALDHLDLVAPVTADALRRWADADPDVAALVAGRELDPGLGGAARRGAAGGRPRGRAPEHSVVCFLVYT